jgi:hypothetical protein
LWCRDRAEREERRKEMTRQMTQVEAFEVGRLLSELQLVSRSIRHFLLAIRETGALTTATLPKLAAVGLIRPGQITRVAALLAMTSAVQFEAVQRAYEFEV